MAMKPPKVMRVNVLAVIEYPPRRVVPCADDCLLPQLVPSLEQAGHEHGQR